MTNDRTVYVQARGGAFYANPRIDFEEGYVTIDRDRLPSSNGVLGALAPLLAVIWVPPVKELEIGWPKVADALDAIFGAGAWTAAQQPFECLASVPGSSPPKFSPAMVCSFTTSRRIPEPTASDGWERFESRIRGEIVFAASKHPGDAKELRAPRRLRK